MSKPRAKTRVELAAENEKSRKKAIRHRYEVWYAAKMGLRRIRGSRGRTRAAGTAAGLRPRRVPAPEAGTCAPRPAWMRRFRVPASQPPGTRFRLREYIPPVSFTRYGKCRIL